MVSRRVVGRGGVGVGVGGELGYTADYLGHLY
jgi:hypothetical protein